ncbi:ATP-binding protein [Streptomyces cavernicola]|uniref:Sensor-like histidine kinase SenX3 n=1 Tax=Streptomyces cavernicola TaxID=3043613 RepID=A0ABT6S7I3_9ACTN|nr:ATP-binding protein [Streptomyces sp. B-S-A6]MDI3404059.1 ATP-binding protein [Streptomyces sp. B-S-A6]
MKLVVQVKLLPTPLQAAVLEATLHACNEAATWASEIAFTKDVKRNFALREHTYAEIKQRWGLGAQAAQHVIKKTCDAYTTLKANLKAGNLGKPWSKRYRRATGKPIAFRPQGAQPYDDRMLPWQIPQRTVSIWTLHGRVKSVAFTAAPEHLARLALYRKGESDLLYRDGMWFLNATCEIPEAEQNTTPNGFLGIDLGIVNIATTSDGEIMTGRALNRGRLRERALRTNLPTGGTVTVHTETVHGTSVLRVENTGIPLPPHLVPTLTEPFQRGTARVRTDDHAGVGLGLAIVHSIVRAHDGTLDVTARPTGGLVVTVRLPGPP